MADFIDNVVESFKQTLDLHLWLYFFAVYLVEGIAEGIVILVFLLFGALAALGFLGSLGLQNLGNVFSSPQALFSNPGFIGFIALALILLAFMVLAIVFIASLFAGIRYNLVNNFLKKKKLDLGQAFHNAMPRTLTMFKAGILITAVILAVLFVLCIPALAVLPGIIAGGPGAGAALGIVGMIFYIFVILGLFALAMFFLSPFFVLVQPTVFFGKLGAIDSLKRAFALAKSNYWANLGFVLIYSIVLMGISFVISIVAQIVGLVLMLPAMAFSGAGNAAMASGMIGSMMLYYMVYIILFIPYTVWSLSLEATSFRNLFFLNSGKEKRK